MEASDVNRLRDMGAEHNKLKRMYAEMAMENHGLKELIAKKAVDPAHKRPLVSWLAEEQGWSERRACHASGVSRSTLRYKARPYRDEPVIAVLAELAERFLERAVDKHIQIIRCRGLPWNHERVWSVYCLMQLNRRRRGGKKRVPTRHPLSLIAGEAINGSWSILHV